MTVLNEMYKVKEFSPDTKTTETISASDTVIKVEDISVFPEAPNVATIGIDGNAEVIKYTGINDSMLIGVTRGIKGIPRAWESGSLIARNISSVDIERLQDNVKLLNDDKLEINSNVDFEMAKNLSPISPTDNISELFSKISKYFDELKSVAFSGEAAHLITDVNNRLVSDEDINKWNKSLNELAVNKIVEQAIKDITGAAPEALDTLVEIAEALGHDPNFATTVMTQIGLKISISEFNEAVTNINNSISDVIESLKSYAKTSDIPDVAKTWDTAITGKVLDAGLGKELFQSGIERNVELVGQLNSKGVDTTTDISLRDNISKVGDIKTGYGKGDIVKSDNILEISTPLLEKRKDMGKFLNPFFLSDQISDTFYTFNGYDIVRFDSNLNEMKEIVSTQRNTYATLIEDGEGNRVIFSSEKNIILKYSLNLELLKTIQIEETTDIFKFRIIENDYILTANRSGLIVLSDTTGKTIKKIQLENSSSGGIYYDENKQQIYVGNNNSKIYLLDNNLNILKVQNVDQPVNNIIHVQDSYIVYGSWSGYVTKLDFSENVVSNRILKRGGTANVESNDYENYYWIDSLNILQKGALSKNEIVWSMPVESVPLKKLCLLGENIFLQAEDNNLKKIIQNIDGYKILKDKGEI